MTCNYDEGVRRGRPAELFGHPAGLTILFLTEMWADFSYYGMRALLVYYMTRRLGFTRRIVQEVNQIHAIIGLVGGGLGVTLVPQSVSKLKISGVVFKPLKNRNAPEAEMTAIWRTNDDSPVVQRFLQIARKVCRAGPDGLAGKRSRR